jgi:hypothetical protein
MQYMMLIHMSPADFESRSRDGDETFWGAWRAYHAALVESGIRVEGHPLQPGSTATTLRIREGRLHVQDGPYADAKEELGGYLILECPTLDVALEWAKRCPASQTGAVEIRPIADLEGRLRQR